MYYLWKDLQILLYYIKLLHSIIQCQPISLKKKCYKIIKVGRILIRINVCYIKNKKFTPDFY